MSVKYQRVKQADLALPAPLRWLTQAFSSITLAVILLSLVFLYGVIGSIPFFFLMVGGIDLLIVLGTVGIAGVISIFLLRRLTRPRALIRAAIGAVLLLVAAAVAVKFCLDIYRWAVYDPFMMRNSAEVIYRLPYFEMTQQQFYAWWPLRLILIIFVLNLIWATIRRIEFSFANIGVLTVHAGIVILAVGALLYGHFKLSGDTIVWRQDLGGGYQRYFYDKSEPALYLTYHDKILQVPLPHLPRYNDYPLGSLNLNLDDKPGVKHFLGSRLKLSIPGFVAYGKLEKTWRPAATVPNPHAKPTPILTLRMGTRHQAKGSFHITLAADLPAQRVLATPAWAIEYVVGASDRRIADLMSTIPHHASLGLIVNIPDKHFHHVYAIHKGQTILAGNTGYQLQIQSVGRPATALPSRAFHNVHDTQATVHISGHGENLTRMVLYRYPGQSHNITPPAPQADHAASSAAPTTTPSAASSPVHLVFLDNRKPQFHLFAKTPRQRIMRLVVDLPQAAPVQARLTSRKFLLGSLSGREIWIHLVRHLADAVRTAIPQSTPKLARHPQEEGTYAHAILPLRLALNRPADAGGPWSRTVWLASMRYPMFPDAQHHPVTVRVPGVGLIKIVFSRRRYRLPFAVALTRFKMVPIPGSHIPRDFIATLKFVDLNPHGKPLDAPTTRKAWLNHPIHYTARDAPLIFTDLEISQAGWDPPTPGDPKAYAKGPDGQYLNQQRFAILGIGNNVGIHLIFLGGCLIILGMPWAFYIKPWLLRRRKTKLERRLAHHQPQPDPVAAEQPLATCPADAAANPTHAPGDAGQQPPSQSVTTR